MPIFTILSVFIFVGLTRTFITEDAQYTSEQKLALCIAIVIGIFQMGIAACLDLLLF